MTLTELNALPDEAARAAFGQCCGAARWVEKMVAARPFADEDALLACADSAWAELGEADWREAFSHHPRIGDLSSLKKKWAGGEQAGSATASEEVLQGLHLGNQAYEQKFGHIFIVCATGKSAAEMLAILTARLANPPEAELANGAAEQAKITRLRLRKLLSED